MTLSCWEKILLVLLVILGVKILWRLSVVVWQKLIGPSLELGLDVTSQGRWAVITGATDGLGKAYAQQLAKRGMDIVLVSRSQSKLEDVAAEIKQEYGVETRIVQADLTEGSAVYAKIAKAIEELEVGVLINNAGAGYDHPEFFANLPEETVARILQLNVAAPTGVTRAVLPGMLARKKGIVIMVSSGLALIPGPLLTVYAASKSYLYKFSRDLAAETANSGVTVQCLYPGLVATKMSKIRKPTLVAPSPEKYVEASLKTLGIESQTTGYLSHAFLIGLCNAINCMCNKALIWLVMRTHLNLRGRALRKKDKMKETASESLVQDQTPTSEAH